MNYPFKNWKEICEEKDKRIKELEDKLQEKWIPCSERLPKEDGWYLETVTYGTTTRTGFGKFKKGIWRHFDDEFKTIAWMPLPEPYRKKVE